MTEEQEKFTEQMMELHYHSLEPESKTRIDILRNHFLRLEEMMGSIEFAMALAPVMKRLKDQMENTIKGKL